LHLRVAVAGVLFALGARAFALSADLADIKAKGFLRVLVSVDEVPETFSLQAEGEHGMEREMLEGFARLHKLELKPVPVKVWEDIFPALLRGEGDLVVAVNVTEARRRQMAFTREVLPSRHVVVTRKPDPPILELPALRAAKVGVPSATTWSEAALEAGVPARNLVDLPDVKAILSALKARRIGATVIPLADLTLALRSDPDLQGGLFVGPVGSAAWALRKTDIELKAALDEHIEASRRTGSWSRLVVKYYGEAALRVLDRAQR
jgi:polar amino acid transport system substrate-binding protein